jgi:hypothetical protein
MGDKRQFIGGNSASIKKAAAAWAARAASLQGRAPFMMTTPNKRKRRPSLALPIPNFSARRASCQEACSSGRIVQPG